MSNSINDKSKKLIKRSKEIIKELKFYQDKFKTAIEQGKASIEDKYSLNQLEYEAQYIDMLLSNIIKDEIQKKYSDYDSTIGKELEFKE